MIEVEGLSKVYSTTAALHDVSFTAQQGEILGFLGPNGAGKTTTMRILAGYLPATSGTARIAGYDVHRAALEVRRRIGYLPETPPLYDDMTVAGFLHFVAQLKGVPGRNRAQQVTSAMERCNLAEKRNVLIRKLSRGFQQRVGIAQAIVHDPPAIILDEPTIGLDPRQIIDVRNLIQTLAGDRTVILSTHILPEVSTTCDRVTIINAGTVVATDTPDNLTSRLAGGTRYEIETDGSFEQLQPRLANVAGVAQVERGDTSDRTVLRAVAEAGAEPGRELAAALVQAGAGLYEMRRTRASLEDVFLQLTTQEPATGSTAPATAEGTATG
ncbi:MAG: MFS transporter [Cyanobacteria bacterium QS_8_64_29]|nr:MAG: MFS transporter [Cyanobacteria bacterium QS_8_64_29]